MVKCEKCNWKGNESELLSEHDRIEMCSLEICPKCNYAWSLVDIED